MSKVTRPNWSATGIRFSFHRSELLPPTEDDCRTLFEGGERLVVQVHSIDRFGHIRLSAKSVERAIEEGIEPVFEHTSSVQLLGDDSAIEGNS